MVELYLINVNIELLITGPNFWTTPYHNYRTQLLGQSLSQLNQGPGLVPFLSRVYFCFPPKCWNVQRLWSGIVGSAGVMSHVTANQDPTLRSHDLCGPISGQWWRCNDDREEWGLWMLNASSKHSTLWWPLHWYCEDGLHLQELQVERQWTKCFTKELWSQCRHYFI